MTRWLTPWRLRVYPRALLTAEALAFAFFVGTATGPIAMNGRVGGDFPAFYAAGLTVLRGQGTALYDKEHQRASEAPFLPASGTLTFAYPAFVAVILAPLGALPYLWAYGVWTVGMLLAVWTAVGLVGRRLPALLAHRTTAFAVAATFLPLSRAIYGGQNTAISLLLAAGAYSADSDVARGAWLGLWLYKPQLALPVIAACAVTRPRTTLGIAPVCAVWWVFGALGAGPGWVLSWLRASSQFLSDDRAVDAWQSVSLADLLTPLAAPLAGAVLVGTAVVALALAHRRPAVAVPFLTCLAPVLAPHALGYDVGLVLLAGAMVACSRWPHRHIIAWLWGAGFLTLIGGPYGTLLCVGTAALLWQSTATLRDGGAPKC